MMSLQRVQPVTANLRVVEADEAHTLLTYLNVIILIWHCSPRAELLHQLYGHAQHVIGEQSVPKVSVVSILPQRFREAPSPTARVALAVLHRDPRNILHRLAIVFLDEGFIVANIRSLLLSVRNRLSGSSKNEVFKSIEDALCWVTAGLPGPGERTLSAAAIVTELKQHLAQSRSDQRDAF